MRKYIIFFFSFFFPLVLQAQELSGKVVAIKDGDTIEVMLNGKPERIRLYGIDCPEKGQAFGERAKQATGELVFGEVVKIEPRVRDHYGRLVAEVKLNEISLNRKLVGAGWCWWYKYYAPEDKELQSLESEARTEKVGLWGDPHPLPPWEFRQKSNRANAK